MTDVLAVDLALLLPESLQAWCRRMNASLLRDEPAGFTFDATHLPHLTLVQQFVRRVDLEQFSQRVGSFLEGKAPISLRGVGSERGGSALRVEATAELQRLHEELMRLSAPFARSEGGLSAFYGDDEPAREADLRWVRGYFSQASFSNFAPHVTLGVGNNPFEMEPLQFLANRVGLCQLGRFGACRKVLQQWTLEG